MQGTRAETLCQNPYDSDRASALELQGGLQIGREALRPSELHHSPDKATPRYHTKNESFASEIFK
jgi:hypothetical protein